MLMFLAEEDGNGCLPVLKEMSQVTGTGDMTGRIKFPVRSFVGVWKLSLHL